MFNEVFLNWGGDDGTMKVPPNRYTFNRNIPLEKHTDWGTFFTGERPPWRSGAGRASGGRACLQGYRGDAAGEGEDGDSEQGGSAN